MIGGCPFSPIPRLSPLLAWFRGRLRRPATSDSQIEVFGPRDQDHAHFSTGPVVGFVVDDLPGAVRELEAAGVELLGGQVDERGGGWRHFRAPDGNVYELTSG
jgi:catechol 2,3-dioxygenase-like lactoylglutathione lyase family enzyme